MWPNSQFPADFVTFTEEILHGKRHFLCSIIMAEHWYEMQRCFQNPVKDLRWNVL